MEAGRRAEGSIIIRSSIRAIRVRRGPIAGIRIGVLIVRPTGIRDSVRPVPPTGIRTSARSGPRPGIRGSARPTGTPASSLRPGIRGSVRPTGTPASSPRPGIRGSVRPTGIPASGRRPGIRGSARLRAAAFRPHGGAVPVDNIVRTKSDVDGRLPGGCRPFLCITQGSHGQACGQAGERV